MSKQITAKQCKKARSLLKWNIHDVVGKTNLSPVRLERFERGTIRLTRPENDELYKLFTKFGLVFTQDFEVFLAEKIEDHDGRVSLNEREVTLLDPRALENAHDEHKERREDEHEAASQRDEMHRGPQDPRRAPRQGES